MGFFKKKPDPISERARTLHEQIAALEAEIQKLSSESDHASSRSAGEKPAQPRLRSTALPQGHSGSTLHAQPPPSPAPQEPVIEDVNPFRTDAEAPVPPARPVQLGVRQEGAPSVWERIKNNFRAPATSNPKLVNYLAAGSIQGLRPLRYEKRVARNRFLLFVVVLAIVIWGVLAVVLKR
jgi:hypothetical protein